MPSSFRKYSVVSLFTGAGGLDLGFEAAGFETRVAVEMDPEAVRTLRHNRNWPLIPHDIHSDEASSERILRLARLREGDADILIGGPPCQPFSKSGYWATGDARRLSDPRASTLGAYLRVLRDTLPKAFLLENVPGIAFTSKDEELSFLRREIERINRTRGVHYTFHAAHLKAVDYGVPQDRQRVFIIGHRDGKGFAFPRATHGANDSRDLLESQHSQHRTAWDAIGALEDDDDPSLKVTGKWAALLPSIPEGLNYLHHTDRGGGLPLFGWRRRFWNFLLKLAKDQPSWTIAAQPGPAIGPFHWRNRRLSSRELALLQTFPKEYTIIGTLRSAQKQVGNAVPSALAERLALDIRSQLLGDGQASGRHPTLIPARDTPVPPAEEILDVPREFLCLVGEHTAHPGTGKGYRASARTEAVA